MTLEERFQEFIRRLPSGKRSLKLIAVSIVTMHRAWWRAQRTSISQAFIRKISTGNVKGSAKTILEANLMGATCSRVCPVEELCEGACVLKADQKPIMIGRLQRYAMDYAADKKIKFFKKGKDNGFKVAVVGAGPAGLSCAGELAKLGFDVTCFEKKQWAGGLDTYGIVVFREPVEVSLDEVKMIEDLGVKIKTNVTIGKDITVDELVKEYDAVFISVGLGNVPEMSIPGENLQGVLDGLFGDQEPAIAVAERLEEHRGRIELAAAPAGVSVEELGPRQAEQQDRRVARELGEVFDEAEERRLRPLQIVEDDHERAAPCQRLEELANGPRRRFARTGAGAAETERLEDQLGDQARLLLAVEELCDRGARRLRAGGSLAAQDLPHDLGQRPVRDALPVRQAVPVQDGRLCAELAGELLHEARLADPGRPQQRQEMAGAVVHDAREDVPERIELVLATDQRRIEAAGPCVVLGRGNVGSGLGRAEDSFLHHLSSRARVGRSAAPGVAHAGTHPTLAHAALHPSAGGSRRDPAFSARVRLRASLSCTGVPPIQRGDHRDRLRCRRLRHRRQAALPRRRSPRDALGVRPLVACRCERARRRDPARRRHGRDAMRHGVAARAGRRLPPLGRGGQARVTVRPSPPATVPAASGPRPANPWLRALAWLRARDRGFSALRRAGRTAIVMPAHVRPRRQGDRQPGRWRPSPRSARSRCCCSSTSGVRCASGCRRRPRSSLVGAVFVCARHARVARPWLAAAAMAVVGVRGALRRRRQLGARRRDDVAAAGVHPARVAAPARPRRSRTGWPAGASPRAAALVAIAVLWPAPARDPLRAPAVSRPAGRSPRGCARMSPTCAPAGERGGAEAHDAAVRAATTRWQHCIGCSSRRRTGRPG